MTLSPKRLQRLVKHRERLERLQEERLAEARHLYARREHALREAERRREQVLDASAPAGGRIDPADLAAAAIYLVRVQREIGARTAALAHSADAVDGERTRLLERRRDVKAIETLLDRRLAEEHLERSRADIKHIDELATRRWVDRADPASPLPRTGAPAHRRTGEDA